MASLPDAPPFLRKFRIGSTPKMRPIMKLEWDKLLAEATEKDTELNKQLKDKEVDNDTYYDDDFYELEVQGEAGDKINSVECDGDRPLNLCSKSHTMPSLGNQLQNSGDVLDLSTGKKPVETKVNWTPSGSVKETSCTVPNFQFNQVSNVSHDKSEHDKKSTDRPVIENKENFPCNNNNLKNKCSTPCNSKPILQDKIIKPSEQICTPCKSKPNSQEKSVRQSEQIFTPFNGKPNCQEKNVRQSEQIRTPCNGKPPFQPKNGRQLEHINKIGNNYKNDIQLNSKPSSQNLMFFSERKPQRNNLLAEKAKVSSDGLDNKKVDCILEKGKSVQEEKKSNNLKAQVSVQPKPPVTSQTSKTEKFAVPEVPAKPKESSKVLVINKNSYQILAPLGKGGSSKVYLVLSAENELLAVKCVKLSDVSEGTKNDYLNEIQHLLKMQHSKHVIRLYDHQYLSSQKLLFVVMERGDTDLSHFLKDKASSDEGISPELIMYYWTEMLMAVKSIHDNNIIHRDLKPANFLLVSGRLKLIDFGIASSIQTEQTSVLMESQSGTFNYMSPEALQDLDFDNKTVLKIGRKTDVWSLGCILYYFLYKKTPYQDLVKPLHKLKAITDPKYEVPFPKIPGVPDILIESCKRCLIHDTKKRASIEELLSFRNRPLFSLSQVLGKLENALSPEEYKKATKAFEDVL